MHSFEQLAAQLLESKGYWTKIGYKINVSKEDKIAYLSGTVKHPEKIPRPEVDLIAYKPRARELFFYECKSYLDSRGINIDSLNGHPRHSKAMKLFNEDARRKMVLEKGREQLIEEKLITSNIYPQLGLIAGKIHGNDQEKEAIGKHFKQRGWDLKGPQWLVEGLTAVEGTGYEDSLMYMVAKIIFRNTELLKE